jgi:hypothetical protein
MKKEKSEFWFWMAIVGLLVLQAAVMTYRDHLRASAHVKMHHPK